MRSCRQPRRQRGVALIVVILLMAAMLLSVLMLARGVMLDNVLAGNIARQEAAAQAADVGIATAFVELQSLVDTDAPAAGWYFPTPLAEDADGLPDVPDWDAARELPVGRFEVRFVVERVCRTTPVTDGLQQCLMSEPAPGLRNANSGEQAVLVPAQRSYRATVHVTGPKNTSSWAQALLTRP